MTELEMLLFCEECGGKNIVQDVNDDKKIVRFRCQHCQYETVVERNMPQSAPDTQAEAKSKGSSRMGVGKAKKFSQV